ncbi:hypothetical protein BJG93_35065 [Paraburkholderia sprentiae WSM5005]|uniref:Uncharacterized protein n=1 Tax=Paraburkholderia sprentiae WSM5005 TaxID=754502 RepID=A0A8F4QIN1_9BURK|nr:hypothetical protein [Paraburkholderia sprentiae]QXE07174.1 hypothetical protein BJG93_35065 [Paraburkholderia sprentiae WSM5005]
MAHATQRLSALPRSFLNRGKQANGIRIRAFLHLISLGNPGMLFKVPKTVIASSHSLMRGIKLSTIFGPLSTG